MYFDRISGRIALLLLGCLIFGYLMLIIIDMQDVNERFREQILSGKNVVIVEDNRSILGFIFQSYGGPPDSYTVTIEEGDGISRCYLDKPGKHWWKDPIDTTGN